MDKLTQRINELILPLFEAPEFHLVSTKIKGGKNNHIVEILADTDSGITIDEITRLNREIGELLEIHDLIRGKYRLEVSSPGLNRPLKELWEFRKNLNKDLKIITIDGDERTEYIGELISVDETTIVLKTAKEEIAIPRQVVAKARVHLKW